MSFGNYRNGNGGTISDDDFTDDEDEKDSYENVPDTVPPPVPRRGTSTPKQADMNRLTSDTEEYDSGVYEVVQGMDDEPIVFAPPPPPPPGLRRPNACTPAAPFAIKTFASRKPSSLENYDDNYPAINNNLSQGRRKSDGLPVNGRLVGGSNLRHQISNGDDDVLNTLKISNVKSKLKPVATKIFESSNDSKDVGDCVVSPSWVPDLRPVKRGGGVGSPKGPGVAEKRPVAETNSPPMISGYKAKTTVAPTESEVGNGQNSLRIKGHLAELRPVKTSNDFVNNYNNATEFTRDQSGSPAWSRDLKKTAPAPAPSGKKMPPVGPPSPKKSPATSAAHVSQPRNRSPSPPPFPSTPPSPPPLRDFPLPPPPDTKKKISPFGSTVTKFSSSDSPQRPRPLATKDPPAPSRPLVPLPSPPACTCHSPPSHNPIIHTQSQNGPEKHKHRNEDTRTQSKTSEMKRYASVPKPPFERSHSGSKSSDYDNNDEHGQRSPRIDEGTQDRYSSLNHQSWFFGDLDREQSEAMLNRLSKEDGAYLVRNSQRGGPDMPYSLSIVFKRHIYHLNIRIRPDGKFSIGKAKSDEKVFNGVVELIAFHRNNPIELIGDNHKKTTSGKVTLNKHPNE